MPRKAKSSPRQASLPTADAYRHPESELTLRPEVGTQANFRKKKPPATYRYDSSLSPALDWDDQPARALGEWLLACIEEAAALAPPQRFPEPRQYVGAGGQVLCRVEGLADAVAQLKALSRPFLDWSGKAERLSFNVPTLPLFVHERLSTEAIVQTLKGHKRDRQISMLDLFGDPQHSVSDQILRAYEHRDKWANRLVLGDSLAVMNSLIHYESLGGQVQMIYMDPPYGVKFGSNFQPFVRKRDVKHNDDEDLTREPEMVKAYRDTWELGLHSYLTYMRDRLLLARELLHSSGSIFVQISDENVHHVREVMDEVFGEDNFCGQILFAKSGGTASQLLASPNDHLIWYAKDKTNLKYRQIFKQKEAGGTSDSAYSRVELSNGSRRPISKEEKYNPNIIPAGSKLYRLDNLTSQGVRTFSTVKFEFAGGAYHPG